MHAESGQFAIQTAGLTSEFSRIARYEDQESRIYDKHGALMFVNTNVAGQDRPEVDRGQLRQMLLDSLPPDLIRWNHQLSAVEPRNDGCMELLFPSGERAQFDLIIGADGTWSRIRPLVSDAHPAYSGVMFVELGIAEADTRHPRLAPLIAETAANCNAMGRPMQSRSPPPTIPQSKSAPTESPRSWYFQFPPVRHQLFEFAAIRRVPHLENSAI